MSKKQFVKYTNFDESSAPRNHNKPKRRHYQQKNAPKPEEPPIEIQASVPSTPLSAKVAELVKKFPKFFTSTSRKPGKEGSENLNQFVIINVRRPSEFVQKHHEIIQQSDDPDWDTGSESDFKFESKKIDEAVKAKAEEKFGNVSAKKINDLKHHEKLFLDDHYKSHRKAQEQSKSVPARKEDSTEKKLASTKQQTKNYQQKDAMKQKPKKANPLDQWLNIDNKSEAGEAGVWIEKIENGDNSDDDFDMADDDLMFDLDDEQPKEQTSSDQDDAFVDEKPTVIHSTKAVGEQPKEQSKAKEGESQGIVFINSYLFSNIAEKIGLPPGGCIWVISNKEERYKVSTEYMDRVYWEHGIYEHYPYVSLNHSEFVHSNDVFTEKGLDKLKKFNQRKIRAQNRYKESTQRKPNPTKKQYQKKR